MKRRTFIQSSLSGLAIAGAGFPVAGRAELPTLLNRNLVAQFMLLGGPDFRHFFAPPFDPTPGSYGREFYRVRATTYGIDATPEAGEAFWNSSFEPLQSGSQSFGMLRGLDWLKSMWDTGNVALVQNVVGAVSRDHDHAQLVWESSDRSLTQTSRPDTGWGGRLAQTGDAQIASLTRAPRLFCLHPHPSQTGVVGTQRIVTLTDPTSVGLFEPDPGVPDDDYQRGIVRALANYYQAKDPELVAESAYRVFADHQIGLEALGDLLRPRFESFSEPAEITGLYSGPTALGNVPIGLQFRSLYYALSAGDLLNLSAVSMAYGSFDSHDNQSDEIENKFFDLFGPGGAMATLYALLPPAIADQLVFVFSGEFGRQLKGNGGNGTDHGRGNTVLIVGNPVSGGIYGDMFPAAELDRLDEPTPDIEGKTDLDAVLAELCDWATPGSSGVVFPDLATAAVEQGVNLAALFTA